LPGSGLPGGPVIDFNFKGILSLSVLSVRSIEADRANEMMNISKHHFKAELKWNDA
jgi:hypothetical protein